MKKQDRSRSQLGAHLVSDTLFSIRVYPCSSVVELLFLGSCGGDRWRGNAKRDRKPRRETAERVSGQIELLVLAVELAQPLSRVVQADVLASILGSFGSRCCLK